MSDEHEVGDLIAWIIPAVPGEPFRVPVESVREGWLVVNAMANLLLYLQDTVYLMADHANAAGVSRWEPDGEGDFDWFDVEEDGDE